MGKEINIIEAEAADLEKFYFRFIDTVVENGEIWTLEEDEEFVFFEGEDEDLFMPFFESEKAALKALNGDFKDMVPSVFDMGMFINDFVPDVAKTDIMMGIVQSEDTYIPRGFVSVRNDLEAAFYEMKGELGHPQNERNHTVDFANELVNMRMEYIADNEKEPRLSNNLQIVYSTYISIDQNLLDEGDDDCPGPVIYSMDSRYNSSPFDLVGITWQINSDLDTDESILLSQKTLPSSMTDGREVFCSEMIFQRAHMPGGQLYGKLFPILVDPEENIPVGVLPKYYWTVNMIKTFIDDDVPGQIIRDMDEKNENARNEILKQSDAEKYGFFLKRSVKDEAVWVLKDGEEYIVIEDKKGQRWLPLWPEEEFAGKAMQDQFKNTEICSVNVYEFTVKYTHKFSRLGWKAAVLWHDRTFIGKSFDELKKDLEEEMAQDFYWI